MKEADLDWKEDAALSAIEAIKMDFGRVPPGSVEERLYSAYQQALARNGKLDFQDMLCQAIEGMESGAIGSVRISVFKAGLRFTRTVERIDPRRG